MEKKEYKPKIGKKVYIIHTGDVYEERVGWIGKDSFIIENYSMYTDDFMEFFYEDHNEWWFSTLAAAKKKCKHIYDKIDAIYLLND